MTNFEFWSAIGIVVIGLYAAWKVIHWLLFAPRTKDDEYPYGDTTGWKKRD